MGVPFMVDRVVLGQGFFQVLWFSPVIIIAPVLHTHISFIYLQPYIILVIDSIVK
jgi:hypothetical protein